MSMGMFGIQWFDNSEKKSLAQKILESKEHFEQKHKQAAEICVVNYNLAVGADMDALAEETGLHMVISSPSIPCPPGHVWVGVERLKTDEDDAK